MNDAPDRIWADEDTWFAGPGKTERAQEYVRADIVAALIREAEARGMERAAEMIMPYVPKMFSVVIYEGTYTDGVTKFPVPFADFGIGVEPEDAHALGIQMTHQDNRWSGLSYTRNDEMRDTEEAVLKKALEPLEAAIRAEAAAIRGDTE